MTPLSRAAVFLLPESPPCWNQEELHVYPAQGKATQGHSGHAQAATEQPLHIDREVLPQAGVHSADAGLEFLRGHLQQKGSTSGRASTGVFSQKLPLQVKMKQKITQSSKALVTQ